MGIGMKELMIILLVALVVFGTKKMRTIGSDLGHAVRGFKSAMNEGEKGEKEDSTTPPPQIRAEGTDAEFPESDKARATTGQKTDRPA